MINTKIKITNSLSSPYYDKTPKRYFFKNKPNTQPSKQKTYSSKHYSPSTNQISQPKISNSQPHKSKFLTHQSIFPSQNPKFIIQNLQFLNSTTIFSKNTNRPRPAISNNQASRHIGKAHKSPHTVNLAKEPAI